MNDTEREIGRLAGEVTSIGKNVDRINATLVQHIADEEKTLKRIHDQLSLSRFAWMVLKAITLTVAFLLAFKFGDITNLWKNIK